MTYSDDDLVSVAVGAQMIGVAPATLRTYADDGKVPVVRTPGNQRRFRVGDLRALLKPEPARPVIEAPAPAAADPFASAS